MYPFVIVLSILCLVLARNPRPWELVGGMNPDFEGFIPPTPVVSEGNNGESAVSNYPHCGVYESQCFDRILASKQYKWTFSGYEEGVPSFIQFNVTYYSNRNCNSTFQYLHMSYTWYVKSITNDWQDWEVTGNNLFIKILSDDVMNSLRCEEGVLVKQEVMSVQRFACFDIGLNGIMFNYNSHFNKTRLIQLRFNSDVLITKSSDFIPPLGVLGVLDSVLNGGTVESGIEYKRVEDFGCCQEDSNMPLIIGICVCAVVVVVIVVVATVLVVKKNKSPKASNKAKKELPKTKISFIRRSVMDVKLENDKAKSEVKMKYVSLLLLVFFTSAQILCMRYARTREDSKYDSNTAVLLGEVMKLVMAFILLSSEKGSLKRAYGQLALERSNHKRDVLLHAVPALLYTVQNNFMYLAISNLDAAVYQVCSQLKLITAAVFSVTFLGKHISRYQWLSLFILGFGLVLVNLNPTSSAGVSQHTNTAVGLFAVLVFCCTSGFAGVFMEKLFKDSKFSVWSRNVWLALFSIISGVVGLIFKDWHLLLPSYFFNGYSFWAWLAVILLAVGGLIIAMVLKYADNIMKAFGNAASIVVSTILSIFLFNFQVTRNFVFGCILVIAAIVMYSSNQRR